MKRSGLYASSNRLLRRNGTILLVVLVVVAAFSVAAYSYSHLMVTELSVVKAKNAAAQQQLLADSAINKLLGLEATAFAALTRPVYVAQSTSHLKSGTLSTFAELFPGKGSSVHGLYAVLREVPQKGAMPTLGLNDESAKLNLNALTLSRSRQQAVNKLMKYEKMRESIALGICDLLGIIDDRSQPIGNRAAPLRSLSSLDELLNVQGITEELLYGEDWNFNGILDTNENDGNRTSPPDDADGLLDRGWSAHWTLVGAESNLRAGGNGKINLNQPNLIKLYDQLLEIATPEQARFVVAWRTTAAIYTDDLSNPKLDEIEDKLLAERKQTFEDRMSSQLGIAITDDSLLADNGSNAEGKSENSPIRGGIDLSRPSSRKFSSLLDLASCQVQVIIDGEDTVLVSPFANDPTSLAKWLPKWEENTTVADGFLMIGRINILQASEQTLQTIHGVTPEIAKAIVNHRVRLADQDLSSQTGLTIGWLLETGIVTTAELRKMADELTVGGCMLNGFALGQLKKSRTATVIYFELDGRSGSLRLYRMLDLGILGHNSRLPLGD